MSPTNLLFIFRSAPYSTPTAQEGLDAVLAAAIFDQQIALLFIGDGVFQLLKNQSPPSGKNQMKMLQSLNMYDIDQVFVQSTALSVRGLSKQDLSIPCTAIADEAIHTMMSRASHVFNF